MLPPNNAGVIPPATGEADSTVAVNVVAFHPAFVVNSARKFSGAPAEFFKANAVALRAMTLTVCATAPMVTVHVYKPGKSAVNVPPVRLADEPAGLRVMA